MTERPYDVHDFDAALNRTRAILDELSERRSELFRGACGHRRAMLNYVRDQSDRIGDALTECLTRLEHDVVKLEEAAKQKEEEWLEREKRRVTPEQMDEGLRRLGVEG